MPRARPVAGAGSRPGGENVLWPIARRQERTQTSRSGPLVDCLWGLTRIHPRVKHEIWQMVLCLHTTQILLTLGIHVAIGWRPNTKIDRSLFWPGRSHIFTLTHIKHPKHSCLVLFLLLYTYVSHEIKPLTQLLNQLEGMRRWHLFYSHWQNLTF